MSRIIHNSIFGSIFLLAISVLLTASPVLSADHQDGLTMQAIEAENNAEEELISDITLPENASPQAHENAAYGLNTANEARRRGREFGQERAEQARELGRDANRGSGEVSNAPDSPGRLDHAPGL